MFGINSLINSINNAINDGTLSRKELASAFGSIENIESSSVTSVNAVNDLPYPVNNKGMFFYIKNENRYVFSDGVSWKMSINDISNLYAWGQNSSGQLGDGTTISRSSPTRSVSFTDWISASAGREHSLGVRANGTIWAWGRNSYGQLGNNIASIINQSSPVSVIGGFTDWISASAGGYHSIGVRANGTLWAWGSNGFGQLGNNTVISNRSPVLAVGGFTDWISASAGDDHSLGVRANGTLWAWGRNGSGRLGDGTTIPKSSPVSVVGGFTDWVSVSAGSFHNIGVRG